MLSRSSTKLRTSFKFSIQDLNLQKSVIKFNELPFELICMIFNLLDLFDLIVNCRLVSKKWLALVDSIINELIIADLDEYSFNNTWNYTLKPINLKNLIHRPSDSYANYLTINYNNFSRLKRLKIDFYCFLDFDKLNKFIQLEHLELWKSMADHRKKSILCLPNLRVLCLKSPTISRLLIDAAKLEVLKCDSLLAINLIHPESIKFLESSEFGENLKEFRSLEVYKMLIGSFEYDKSLLSKLPSCLKEFHFQFHYELENSADYFKFILKNKLEIRSDLKIYIDGIELTNKLDFNQFGQGKLKSYHFNYEQLTILPQFEHISYCELIKLFNNSIPNDFFIKFNNIRYVSVDEMINRQDQFVWFLKGCHHLSQLQIFKANLNQEFFNELPQIASLLFKLILEHNNFLPLQIDFKFISEFKQLVYLKTDHDISSESAKYLIKNTKFLKKLKFKNNDSNVLVNKTLRTYKSYIEISNRYKNIWIKQEVNDYDELDTFFDSQKYLI